MTSKINISNLFIIAMTFGFLNHCAFPIGKIPIPIYFISISLFLLIYVSYFPKYFQDKIMHFFRTKAGIILSLTIGVITLGLIISVFRGNFIVSKFFTNFINTFILSSLFPFFATMLTVPKMICNKKIHKFLLLTYFIIFVLGIIGIFAVIYDIEFIKNFLTLFSLRQDIVTGHASNRLITAFGMPRVSSVFCEPAPFAYFILISSPIIYQLCKTKAKIFNNFFVDKFLKKTTILMLPICLLFTQSPIFIIFFSIVIGCYVIYRIYKSKQTYIKYIITCLALLLLCFLSLLLCNPNIDLTNTSFSRVFATFNNLTNFAGLVYAEPSFATHLSCHIFSILVFFKYPFIGIGYGNSGSVLTNIILQSSIPLTPEIYKQTLESDILGGSSSILIKSLAETGILGTILFFYFCFTVIKNSFFIINKLNEINKNLLLGTICSVIIILAFSFYDTFFISIIWIYIGLLQAYILRYKKCSIISQSTYKIHRNTGEHFKHDVYEK